MNLDTKQEGIMAKSNKNHDGTVLIQFYLDKEDTAKLDAKVKERGYSSRTEWFREQVRNTINDKPLRDTILAAVKEAMLMPAAASALRYEKAVQESQARQ
jgi:metal-responsive CopG/Arc/MetJ family transcriptional regulator